MATNPLTGPFTGNNIIDALFKTFKESVELNNGKQFTKVEAMTQFCNNLSFVAPERYRYLFWEGNPNGYPPWRGICGFCQAFGTDATPPLFQKIIAHYNWRKKTYGDDAGFVREEKA